jgi:class 3 adenylate cyclase/tetratricopeptide (TPR) repeat protein
VTCPVCGEENAERARFCSNCGSPLGATPATSNTQRLERYLPQGMLAKLEAARAGRAMQGERRIVTMLFCDVVGSTAMAETLDPEEWTGIMNGAFELLIAPVFRYEGTLARLMGDAIFAFFGAPIAHEDDPQRAVLAGLKIVEGIGEYREKLLADRGLDLNVRVGINTGPVIVGEVGSDLRLEYTAMGDAVNVAARMEQTAEPGTVQITGETRRLVEAAFELEPRGTVEVKGKAEPIEAFRVVGATRTPVGARAFADREAPLVGRRRELDALREAADAVLDRSGRMVCLIGDAGLGKSRLIEETRRYFRRRLPEPPANDDPVARWEVWQCVSYDANRPYAQYRRLLAQILDIRDTDPPEVVRAKLTHPGDGGASAWAEGHTRVRRALFDVLEPGEEPLEGQAFHDAILELVPAFTRYFGSDPRILVFEDLHWCDEASMDMIIETSKLIDELPLLILFAFRPDRGASSWRLKQWLEVEYPHRTTELALAPFSADEAGALVDELLPGERYDAVRSRVLERTEGNPLFVEELAATIRDRGGDGGDLDVPATLQALITARVDTLDDDTRRVLRLASVIGRTFDEDVLGAVAGDGDVLRGRLAALERAGLIGETARRPEREYAFRHSLTQDATYATMLVSERRELHQRVGEVLESMYASRLAESAALLARHFEEAGDDERALRYAAMAGDEAARLHAAADAVTHYRAAIDAAGRLGRAGERIERLYPNLGRSLEIAGRHAEAAAAYEEMRALADSAGDRASMLRADLSLATLFGTPTPLFEYERARAITDRVLTLARELDDRETESKALWMRMIANVYGGGDMAEALEAGEHSLALARDVGARDHLALVLTDLWRPYVGNGDLRSARATLDEARPILRELEDLPILTENLAGAATLSRVAGEDDEAIALAEEAREISVRTRNGWGEAYALMCEYDVYRDRGEIGSAIAMMRRCLEIADRAGFVPPLALVRADLAVVLAGLGDVDTARRLVDEASEVARERQPITVPWVITASASVHVLAGELDEAAETLAATGPHLMPEAGKTMMSVWSSLVRAQLALARADHDEAIELADAILERLQRLGIRPFVAETLLVRGRSLAAAGRADEAERALLDARADADALGHRLVLWEICAALSDVVAGPDGARRFSDEARRHVEAIANTIDDARLRTAFTERPDVARLLDA